MEFLGQLKPANTTAAAFFTPETGNQYLVNLITVSNVSAGIVKFRIFFDNDGTTYDETTSLYWDIELQVGETYEINFGSIGLPLKDSTGRIGVRTDTADAINFMAFGEITLTARQ